MLYVFEGFVQGNITETVEEEKRKTTSAIWTIDQLLTRRALNRYAINAATVLKVLRWYQGNETQLLHIWVFTNTRTDKTLTLTRDMNVEASRD